MTWGYPQIPHFIKVKFKVLFQVVVKGIETNPEGKFWLESQSNVCIRLKLFLKCN